MPRIKPTFSLTSNAAGSTNEGPLSVALTLSTTTDLGCDDVHSGVYTMTGTDSAILFDGETQNWRSSAPTGGAGDGAGGTVGGYVYIKNVTPTGTGLVYIGIGSDEDNPDTTGAGSDISAADQLDDFGDGADGEAPAGVDAGATRFMTLKKDEFAFFPWDYTTRILIDSSTATPLQKVEWWIFDRGSL
tara:strand:+ start:496 stop:1059 length:564 start_codon:yes stop_codon:yes gene_type:complete